MLYNEDYDYGEDFNKPDYVKIDNEEYQKMKDKIEYYEKAIENIKEIIKELENEIK